MSDNRIVYSAGCTWWDSIDKIGRHRNGLPTCPHCGSVLFEVPNEETWFENIGKYEEISDDKEYSSKLKWARGKCFKNMSLLDEAYQLEKKDG